MPPGLQGIIDDFWQRPIPSVGEIDGRKWSWRCGFARTGRGKGGKYLILPPDYTGEVPPGYLTYRSGTYGVFVFWRGFFTNPKRTQRTCAGDGANTDLSARKEGNGQADAIPRRLAWPPTCFIRRMTAFDMLSRFIEHEYVDPADMYMRGMAAELGIVKGKPFAPDALPAPCWIRRRAPPRAWATSWSIRRRRSSRMYLGIPDRHGSTPSPVTQPSRPTRSTTSTRAPPSSPTPIPPARPWRSA